REHEAVFPLYVQTGLAWESVELDYLGRFLKAVQDPALRPLHVLALPVNDLYRTHWSLTGRDVPDARSPDEAVFCPGRNVLLLALRRHKRAPARPQWPRRDRLAGAAARSARHGRRFHAHQTRRQVLDRREDRPQNADAS